MTGEWRGRRGRNRVHRIEDRPEHHDAPGAWAWDRGARRRRDVMASQAAERFLDGAPAGDDCWRCEVSLAVGALGLCQSCLEELRRG